MIALDGNRSQSFPALGISPLPSLDLNLSAYDFLPQQQGSEPAYSSVASSGRAPQGFQGHESLPIPQSSQQQLPHTSGGPQQYFYPMAQSTAFQPAYPSAQSDYIWEQTDALQPVNLPSSGGPFQATLQPSFDSAVLPPVDSPMSNGNPGKLRFRQLLMMAVQKGLQCKRQWSS